MRIRLRGTPLMHGMKIRIHGLTIRIRACLEGSYQACLPSMPAQRREIPGFSRCGGQPFSCAPSLPYGTLYNCPGHLAGIRGISLRGGASFPRIAGVAQSVEHLICNQRVGGSNPFASSRDKKENFPAGGRSCDATGFSNALHSELFRRAVIFAVVFSATLVSLFCES